MNLSPSLTCGSSLPASSSTSAAARRSSTNDAAPVDPPAVSKQWLALYIY